MSEKIELIPASELPVAEGDEVSVLCLENGELKQKPANGLGGSGGSHWIMNTSTDQYNSDAIVSEGLYEALENMFTNGIPVPVTAFRPQSNGSVSCDYGVKTYTKLSDGTGFRLAYNSSQYWTIRKDGNHTYYWDF